jgi:hypothetical protein
VKQDEKAFKQKGPFARGSLLGRSKKGFKGISWKGMPQVKGLQELNVARLATR